MSLKTRREREQTHNSRGECDNDNHMMNRLVTSIEKSKADWLSG